MTERDLDTVDTSLHAGIPVANVAADPQVLTPEQEAEVQALYDELKPEAEAGYVNFFLNRTPAPFQEAMKALVDAGITPPEPPADPVLDANGDQT